MVDKSCLSAFDPFADKLFLLEYTKSLSLRSRVAHPWQNGWGEQKMIRNLLMFLFPLGLFPGLVVLPLYSASAQMVVSVDQESGVEAARLARFRAMIDRDLEALDELLTTDLTYSHTTGRVESKESFLNTVGSDLINYLSAEPRSVETRNFGEVAVATGLSDMRLITEGEQLEFTIRFLEVYRMEQGKWRLAAWQSVMNTTTR